MNALADLICIEPMRAADLPQVVAIDRMSFPSPWPAHAFAYELEHRDNSFFFCAREPVAPAAWYQRWRRTSQQRVVGYVGYWLALDEAHISTIAVHPTYRGQGIGQRLLRTALVDARERGAHEAKLEVRVSNHAAQRLYRKHGFESVGRRKGYYRDNAEDALLMTASPIPDLETDLQLY